MNKEFLLPDEAAALESFRDYLLDRERAAATISKYMTDARKLLHFLNGEKLLNKERMIAFKDWLWEHYKPASCNSIIAAVNQFLESLGGGDFKIRQFKRQRLMARPGEKYLTQEEFTRLIKTAQNEKKYRLAAAMAANKWGKAHESQQSVAGDAETANRCKCQKRKIIPSQPAPLFC